MVIPSIEEEVEEEVEVEEDCEWFQERQMDRPNRRIGRGFFHGNEGNEVEVQQVQTGKNSSPIDKRKIWSTPATCRKEGN